MREVVRESSSQSESGKEQPCINSLKQYIFLFFFFLFTLYFFILLQCFLLFSVPFCFLVSPPPFFCKLFVRSWWR